MKQLKFQKDRLINLEVPLFDLMLLPSLFLFILVSWLAKVVSGYIKGLSNYNLDIELQKINKNQKKWQMINGLTLIAHSSVIVIAILFFFLFSAYNLLLIIIYTIFRIGEGLILIYLEKPYRELLNIAKQYSVANNAEKNALIELTRTILKTKHLRFKYTQLLWAQGTLALSITLVTPPLATFEWVPPFIIPIGLLGIAASITVGLYNMMYFKNHDEGKILRTISGLLEIIFELILGVWIVILGIMIHS